MLFNNITVQYPLYIMEITEPSTGLHVAAQYSVAEKPTKYRKCCTKSIDMLNKNPPGVKKRSQVGSLSCLQAAM